ncbi:MAG: GldG family protein [Clostridia bacterium]|nr:GldG family protein [Clostridia bacterium]MCI1999254.1 GldG family protein [Clostridia bacterium]MCI2014793.1 GldG family protein [Clostridia bacterium]
MKKIDKNDPLLKYGGYASIMTAIVLVVIVIINLAVSQFDIKFDLTKNKLYTLSEDTVSLLKNLNEDVSIYSLYPDGEEVQVVTEILDKYASYSKHIHVSNVDPYKDPTFATKYSQNGNNVTAGSLVVTTAKGSSVIPQSEVMDVQVDSNSQTAYYTGVKVESSLTGTIRKLTSGLNEYAYELTGHGETVIGDNLKTEMGYSNIDVKSLDLLTEKAVPDDCSILIINGPTSDFSSAELDSIKAFLENGGKAFITIGMTIADMPNFASLLADYGIADSRKVVIEGSADYVLNNNAVYLLPQLNADHEICSKLVSAGTKVFIPACEMISRLQTVRNSVKIETLAQSSSSSYAKDIATLNTDSSKTDSDPKGPMDLAVAISDTDSSGNEAGTKLIVCGSNTIDEDDINSIVNGGNFAFIMNSLNWLSGYQGADRSKSIGAQEYLNLTQSKAIIIMFVCVIIIPLAILIAGFVVFLRRRNK